MADGSLSPVCLEPTACRRQTKAAACRRCTVTARNRERVRTPPPQTRRLTSELIARGVVAAAISYGDDPLKAFTGKAHHQRRALTAAANGIAVGAEVTVKRVCGLLGIHNTTVHHAVQANRPGFWKASQAAEAAVREHIKAMKARGETLDLPAPAQKAVAKAKAETPRPPRLPAAPKRASPSLASLKMPANPAPVRPAAPAQPVEPPRAPSILDGFKRGPEPGPGPRTPLAVMPDAAPVIAPSVRCGSRTVGKPAPMKSDPRRGCDPQEFAFVSEKRGKGVPWSAISTMTGVSVITLRQRYDPAFEGVS